MWICRAGKITPYRDRLALNGVSAFVSLMLVGLFWARIALKHAASAYSLPVSRVDAMRPADVYVASSRWSNSNEIGPHASLDLCRMESEASNITPRLDGSCCVLY